MTSDPAIWKKRIDAARQRRQQHESTWAEYATLHARARDWASRQDANDDESIRLPNGDQIKLSLVHRNIEQTLGILEVPEIGVRATIMEDDRELGIDDSNRESVVEQALINSSKQSGLMKGSEEVDYVKRDGVIVGHGINYTWFRQETREVETERIAVFHEIEPGRFDQALDEESGEPLFEARTETRTVYQAVQDEHVPVLEFLFDSRARRMDQARWHGREQIVALDSLRQDSRFDVPDDIEPTTFIVKDLYGANPFESQDPDCDYVRKITIWDKDAKLLLTFIEAPRRKNENAIKEGVNHQLLLIGEEHWPITFSHPDDSPFSFFIPLPANDDPWGISQIEHVRNQTVEADKLRTRQANITRQIKRIVVARKGMVDQDQWDEAIKQPDMALVHLDIPEDFDRNRDLFELPVPRLSPELLQQQQAAEVDVDKTSGISAVPFGGASTATESENMMQVGGARPNRKRRLYFKFMESVLGRHLDFLREFGPDGQTVTIMGPDGAPIRTVYGREAFKGRIDIEIQASGELTISPVRQKMLIELGGLLLGKYGPGVDRLFMAEVLAELNFRGRNRILNAISGLPAQGPMGEPGVSGQVPPGFNPNDQTMGQAIRAAINAPNE